jgi:RHS repeat-associated protein
VVGTAINESALTLTKTTDYVGNKIYENGTLKMLRTENGYYDYSANKYYFYVRDHLGNNRVVTDQTATAVQSTQYYPFGMAFATSTGQNGQRFKYNNKELDLMHGLNMYDYSARGIDMANPRFTTQDPLAEKYYSISPYAYCGNNPMRYIDPTGLAPIYDPYGNFLGTDDDGLQGYAYIMNKDNFTQGMSRSDAEKHMLSGFVDDDAKAKFNESYNSLSVRPDYDGFVTIEEGVQWALAHSGALDNPTPENSLYINTALLDFGDLTVSDFPSVGVTTPVNLFTSNNTIESAFNSTLRATVYALGRVDMILTSSGDKWVKIVNNSATDYDWNLGGGSVRNAFIQAERARTGLNDSHGFKVNYYGTGVLRNYSRSQLK